MYRFRYRFSTYNRCFNMAQVLVLTSILDSVVRCPTLSAKAAVAQLDRVLGYEPRGRGFDSCQPHQM